MPVTPEQAAQLADLAAAIRPHGARRWDKAGIVAAIGRVKHLSLADVAMAVIRAADDRSLDTPGAIGNSKAPCWADRRGDRPQPIEPFNRRIHCDVCGKTADRHGDLAGHPFETRHDADHRRAHDGPKPPLRELATPTPDDHRTNEETR